MARKRATKVEKLLAEHRAKPSPICHDPRQISLFDVPKNEAFAKLDAAIAATMAADGLKRRKRSRAG